MREKAVEEKWPTSNEKQEGPTQKQTVKAWSGKFGKIVLPLLAGIVFFVLWEVQFFHTVLNLKTYQLPLPSVILEAIRDNLSTLISFSGYTFIEAFLGLLLGSSIGFIIALIATAFPKWGKGALTLVVALNAVPIVALAPIMNLWFGSGIGSRVAIVTVTTMVAMAVNAHKGMSNVNPLSLDLMHAYAANKIEVFRYLRIANSLPYVFTALKINATASMIGAIVGEFFYASKGLGYLLSNSIKVAQMPLGWACIVIASIVGITFYLVVELLEKLFMKWHPSERV
ncbi:MAG: ABC transporter permease [Solibacillus sp.]